MLARMTDSPVFLIPGTSDDELERRYAELAAMCSCEPPPPGERISSIRYGHDGSEWVATVGETLRGEKITRKRRKGEWVERRETLTDPATVLAIFPGSPYLVVTDKGPFLGNANSWWENPFMAGVPKSVRHFGG
jgi:hypothetical protein